MMTDPNKIFDGLMVLQYRTGTKKALNILVNKYHNKLCKHAYGYTNDLEASQDIVQDCWGIMVKKLDSLKDPNLFGSWAFRIVTRKSLDFIHQKKRESVKLHDYFKTSNSDDKEVYYETDIQKLLKAIQTLPKDHQVVIRLFYREHYTLGEISSILEIAPGTVKSRLFHAREKLKLIFRK